MSAHEGTANPGPDAGGPPGPDGWSVTALILVINALFAGVGALYMTTRSVTITVVASLAITGLIALMLVRDRRARRS